MKSFKSILISILASSSLCSTTFAIHKCPSALSINYNIAGKKADRLSTENGKYSALWWANFDTGHYEQVWGFSVSNVTAANEKDAFEKIEKSLSTLTGTPEPEFTRWGLKCSYKIGFGYQAIASTLSV